MKEKKVSYGWIIAIAIIIILFIPIISDYIKKQGIDQITSKEVNEKISAKESFVAYIGEPSKEVKKVLKKIKNLDTTDYSLKYSVYSISDSSIKKAFGEKTKYVIVIDGDIQKVYTSDKGLTDDVDAFIIGNITKKNRSYKVAENFNEYKKLVKANKITMAVFGRNSCFHCNRFKPVYNAIASKYDLDIYFFDSDNYNKDEYGKIINMNLTVPAKCSSDSKEFKLSSGFGTPLTIFTKKGKVVDCISGYTDRENLIKDLKTVGLISE